MIGKILSIDFLVLTIWAVASSSAPTEEVHGNVKNVVDYVVDGLVKAYASSNGKIDLPNLYKKNGGGAFLGSFSDLSHLKRDMTYFAQNGNNNPREVTMTFNIPDARAYYGSYRWKHRPLYSRQFEYRIDGDLNIRVKFGISVNKNTCNIINLGSNGSENLALDESITVIGEESYTDSFLSNFYLSEHFIVVQTVINDILMKIKNHIGNGQFDCKIYKS